MSTSSVTGSAGLRELQTLANSSSSTLQTPSEGQSIRGARAVVPLANLASSRNGSGHNFLSNGDELQDAAAVLSLPSSTLLEQQLPQASDQTNQPSGSGKRRKEKGDSASNDKPARSVPSGPPKKPPEEAKIAGGQNDDDASSQPLISRNNTHPIAFGEGRYIEVDAYGDAQVVARLKEGVAAEMLGAKAGSLLALGGLGFPIGNMQRVRVDSWPGVPAFVRDRFSQHSADIVRVRQETATIIDDCPYLNTQTSLPNLDLIRRSMDAGHVWMPTFELGVTWTGHVFVSRVDDWSTALPPSPAQYAVLDRLSELAQRNPSSLQNISSSELGRTVGGGMYSKGLFEFGDSHVIQIIDDYAGTGALKEN